jgi:hypothetical protein
MGKRVADCLGKAGFWDTSPSRASSQSLKSSNQPAPRLLDTVLSHPKFFGDETPLPVLDPGRGKTAFADDGTLNCSRRGAAWNV